jgi:hypothetical protein
MRFLEAFNEVLELAISFRQEPRHKVHPARGIGSVRWRKGRNHTVEQEAPFDADEVITKASEWADRLENSGLPKGWSRKP